MEPPTRDILVSEVVGLDQLDRTAGLKIEYNHRFVASEIENTVTS
jgi:hypothetical protein